MSHQLKKFTISLTTVLFAGGVLSACIRKSSSSHAVDKQNSMPSTPAGATPASLERFAISGLAPLTEKNLLGRKFADLSVNDVFVSLAVCDCLPKLQTALITSLNSTRGALPQALTPAVRREILSNGKLKILNIIPRPIDDIVGGLFADEMTVAQEISDGLKSKIKLAEPAWADSQSLPPLQLDGFVPLPGTLPPTSGRTVRLLDVWTRWGLVVSQGGPWSSARKSVKDSGLLWLELLRALAEGEYLFGLAGSGEGKTWGGLTIPVDLQINNVGPFDPRSPYSQIRFLSGQLDLTLSSNNSLSLARYGGERWTWRENSIPLAEQAIQWWIGSRMLNRLRPLNRGAMTTLFPDLIPDDSYQLSLLVLPALDALLSARFVDENSRLVRSYITGAQVSGISTSVREKADPQTLSLLLMALSGWINELSTTSDLNVSAETARQLKDAPRALLRGAQLIVQTILGETIAPRSNPAGELKETPHGVFLNPQERTTSELTLRDHAQVLHALISTETKLMPSPYLRSRILQLATGLAQRWQESHTFDPSKDPLAQVVWLKTASELMIQSYPEAPVIPVFKDMTAELDRWLQAFEESALK